MQKRGRCQRRLWGVKSGYFGTQSWLLKGFGLLRSINNGVLSRIFLSKDSYKGKRLQLWDISDLGERSPSTSQLVPDKKFQKRQVSYKLSIKESQEEKAHIQWGPGDKNSPWKPSDNTHRKSWPIAAIKRQVTQKGLVYNNNEETINKKKAHNCPDCLYKRKLARQECSIKK